jgi:large subunit ribosomal protein L4
MSKLLVKDINGNQQGEYDIAEDLLVFDKGGQAVKDAVTAYRAGLRAGSASTKTRAEVRGSGRKPWKQKGLGRARVGTKQNPIWRGGGVAFGPKPRKYNKKLTKKVARLAFRRAFSEKVAAGDVEVLDELTLPEPRTKLFAEIMEKVGTGRLTLILVEALDDNLKMASRNIPGIDVKMVSNVNTYDLLRYSKIIIVKDGLQTLVSRLGGNVGSDK